MRNKTIELIVQDYLDEVLPGIVERAVADYIHKHIHGSAPRAACEAQADRVPQVDRVPREVVLPHIQKIRDTGLSWRAIADIAGIAQGHMYAVREGIAKTVSRAVAENLFAAAAELNQNAA